jgi:hypothetical protein
MAGAKGSEFARNSRISQEFPQVFEAEAMQLPHRIGHPNPVGKRSNALRKVSSPDWDFPERFCAANSVGKLVQALINFFPPVWGFPERVEVTNSVGKTPNLVGSIDGLLLKN